MTCDEWLDFRMQYETWLSQAVRIHIARACRSLRHAFKHVDLY